MTLLAARKRTLFGILTAGLLLALLAPGALSAAVGDDSTVGGDSSVGDDSSVGEDSDVAELATLRFQFEVINDWAGTLTPDDFSTTVFPEIYESTNSQTVANGGSATVPAGENGFDWPRVDYYDRESVNCVDTNTGAIASFYPFIVSQSDFIVDLAAGGDVTCTLTYSDQASNIFIDVSLDGDFFASGDIVTKIDGVEYLGFVNLEVFPGEHTIEAIGGPGYELVSTFCEIPESNDPLTGPIFDVPEFGGVFCEFQYQTISVSCADVEAVTYNMNLPQSATNRATSGRDIIRGTAGDDVIRGLGGNDVICGLGGNDIIYAGAGNDVIYAGPGDDTVYGAIGDDDVYGGTGNDVLRGGAGNDEIRGAAGNDEMFGATGYDELIGGTGDDVIFGGADEDTITGSAGNDDLRGGPGNDYVYGQAGDDELRGGLGDDVLFGNSGNDLLFGNAGNDALVGGSGDDLLNGGLDSDELSGGPGSDRLLGGSSVDRLQGGGGNDVLFGGPDFDELFGEAGADELYGGGGPDELYGGAGRDQLIDRSRNDNYLVGGTGRDSCTTNANYGETYECEVDI